MASNDKLGSSSQTPAVPLKLINFRGLIDRKGAPVPPGTRLPSIQTRDLTLGGSAKRTFTPTIPVRKIRNKKENDTGTFSEAKHNEQGQGDEKGQGRGRGRGRGRREFIQTQGSVFAEGLFEKTSRSSNRGSSSRNSVLDAMPVLNAQKTEVHISKEEEQEHLQRLLQDNFIDDDEGEEDEKLMPVQLPLEKSSLKTVKREVKLEKTEKMEIDEDHPNVNFLEKKSNEKKDVKPVFNNRLSCDEENLSSLTSSDIFYKNSRQENGKLLFFQLPDCLPGSPLSGNDEMPVKQEPMSVNEPSSTNQKQNESSDENGKTSKQSICTLADLSEGYLGKMKIYKSGKVLLHLGNVPLNVETGTQVGFLQDVVSVHTEENPGKMIVLGHIAHRFLCIPDLDNLLISSQT